MKKVFTLEIEATGRNGSDAMLQDSALETAEAAVLSLPFSVASVTVSFKLTAVVAEQPKAG